MYLLHLTVKLQRMSFQFRPSKNGRNPVAANNFPPHIPNNIFMIVNTSKSDSPGTHWLVICNRRNVLYFADPLGRPLWQYTILCKPLNEKFHQVTALITNFPMQDSNFTMCGSFCNYIGHLIYDKRVNGDASDFVLHK